MAVVISTDAKLEQVAGRTYGMCRCSWSPPFEQYDFERGFVLPNPTKLRVAAQAVLWALESIQGANFLNPEQDTVIVATKNKWLHEILTSRMAKCLRTGKWPDSIKPVKALATKAFNMMQERKDFITLVCIEAENEDESIVDLDENRTDKGFDMDAMTKKGATPDEITQALQKTRMNGVMAEKLLTSGARCYRPQKK